MTVYNKGQMDEANDEANKADSKLHCLIIKDFIPEFSKFLQSRYPIKPLWADLLAALTLAVALDQKTFYHNRFGDNRVNLWIAYIAPSGEFKSTPYDEIIEPLLEYIFGEENTPTLPSVLSTAEGMIKFFSTHKDNRSGVINRDELTTFFSESLNKSYLTGEMEFYSRMYDGKINPRATMKIDSKHTMQVCVNLVGATTPRYLYDQLNINFFFQGCGNRFLYVRYNVPETKEFTGEELHPPAERKNDEGIPIDQQEFANFLLEVHKGPYDIVMSDKKCADMSAAFRVERNKLKYAIDDMGENAFKREYINRDWQKMLKLAQLRSISRMAGKAEIQDVRTVDISVEDMTWAIETIIACYADFETIVNEWKTRIPAEPPKIRKDSMLLGKYLSVVKSWGIVSQVRLAREVDCPGRGQAFMDIVGSLISGGYIEELPETGDQIRKRGEEWMLKQMINPKFKAPPHLYKFVADMPD